MFGFGAYDYEKLCLLGSRVRKNTDSCCMNFLNMIASGVAVTLYDEKCVQNK